MPGYLCGAAAGKESTEKSSTAASACTTSNETASQMNDKTFGSDSTNATATSTTTMEEQVNTTKLMPTTKEMPAATTMPSTTVMPAKPTDPEKTSTSDAPVLTSSLILSHLVSNKPFNITTWVLCHYPIRLKKYHLIAPSSSVNFLAM